MGKLPEVERDAVLGSLTYECAAKWLLFIAEEADFEGDSALANSYRQRAKSLMHTRMPRGYLHDKNLEDEIKKWTERKPRCSTYLK